MAFHGLRKRDLQSCTFRQDRRQRLRPLSTEVGVTCGSSHEKRSVEDHGFGRIPRESHNRKTNGSNTLERGVEGVSQTLAGGWKTGFRMAGPQNRAFCGWLFLARLQEVQSTIQEQCGFLATQSFTEPKERQAHFAPTTQGRMECHKIVWECRVMSPFTLKHILKAFLSH